MLAEHRIDDADKCFVAVEKTVPSRKQITFQPTLALMFAEHRIQNLSGRSEKLVIVLLAGVPLPISNFKHCAEKIG